MGTIFQNLNKVFSDGYTNGQINNNTLSYVDSPNSDKVVYSAKSQEEYDLKKLELQQNKYLAARWLKTNINLSLSTFQKGVNNNVQLMYREVELMDKYPVIGTALDIVAEEATIVDKKGKSLQIHSSSERIKAILEDLFYNRLDILIMAPMIIRGLCKYGNQFMLLNIDKNLGVTGWKQMPAFNMIRVENGVADGYTVSVLNTNTNQVQNDLSTKFIWLDNRDVMKPYYEWEMAHFRLLHNAEYLPYGASYLNSARRHWRMLALMEDMMLIYRLERSAERRVFKIFVGAIDDSDVRAYVEGIANEFKRTPIVDPETGQLDLHKNLLDVSQDIFIPVREQNAANPIDTLSAGQNLTAIDDIKYILNLVLTALCIPKKFLTFDEPAGDGKNLSLMDVRFARRINRIQQSFLMELNKIAAIHLYLLGFEDELDNFSLGLNNPSTQAEALEIDTFQKKIGAFRDAVVDPGNGIPIMSMQRAYKEVLGWSPYEIKTNFEEIRLERVIKNELDSTGNVISKSGLFDRIDNMYRNLKPSDQNQQAPQKDPNGEGGGMPPMGGGGGGGMPPMMDDGLGGEADNLGFGEEGEGEIQGNEGEIPMDDDKQMTNDSFVKKGNLITETIQYRPKCFNGFNKNYESLNEMIDKFNNIIDE